CPAPRPVGTPPPPAPGGPCSPGSPFGPTGDGNHSAPDPPSPFARATSQADAPSAPSAPSCPSAPGAPSCPSAPGGPSGPTSDASQSASVPSYPSRTASSYADRPSAPSCPAGPGSPLSPFGPGDQVPSPRRKVSSEGVPAASMSPTVCVCSSSAFSAREPASPITLLWGNGGIRDVGKTPLPILVVGSSGISSTLGVQSPGFAVPAVVPSARSDVPAPIASRASCGVSPAAITSGLPARSSHDTGPPPPPLSAGSVHASRPPTHASTCPSTAPAGTTTVCTVVCGGGTN